jgi:hypothetical protein|tara:strand:+ start:11946 stop:12101 length:156 start_codon:yes stop_codon:yes gene_type:complete
MESWRVIVTDEDKEVLVAEYLFESMKEAIKFHSQMTAKGYHSEMHRVVLDD